MPVHDDAEASDFADVDLERVLLSTIAVRELRLRVQVAAVILVGVVHDLSAARGVLLVVAVLHLADVAVVPAAMQIAATAHAHVVVQQLCI